MRPQSDVHNREHEDNKLETPPPSGIDSFALHWTFATTNVGYIILVNRKFPEGFLSKRNPKRRPAWSSHMSRSTVACCRLVLQPKISTSPRWYSTVTTPFRKTQRESPWNSFSHGARRAPSIDYIVFLQSIRHGHSVCIVEPSLNNRFEQIIRPLQI